MAAGLTARDTDRERIDAKPPRRGLVGPFSGKQIAALLASVLAVGVVLAALNAPVASAPPLDPAPAATVFDVGPPTEGLQPGERAPELAGEIDGQRVELVDLDGHVIRLAEFRGRPVWINFFATWCPPCQAETPILRDVYEAHEGEGLVLLGISVQESSPEDVRRYAETYELGFPIGFDATSAVFKAYRAYGLPTQIFLDGDGVVRLVHRGPLTRADAERVLAPLLAAE